jgi:pyocin large subunit-like protein
LPGPGGKGKAVRFAAGKWLSHFAKHGSRLGFKTSIEYLRGAQALTRGGPGVSKFQRGTDTLFYKAATNEFAVLTNKGIIRTYFKPKDGIRYWNHITK